MFEATLGLTDNCFFPSEWPTVFLGWSNDDEDDDEDYDDDGDDDDEEEE